MLSYQVTNSQRSLLQPIAKDLCCKKKDQAHTHNLFLVSCFLPMALYVISVCLILSTLAILHLTRHRIIGDRKGYNFPPGPKKLPIIGNLHQLGSLPHRSLWSLSQNHGPLMHLQLGSIPILVVSSAAMAKEVLKTHDLSFCSRPKKIAMDKYAYGSLDVAFSPYGEYWCEMRRVYTLELFNVKKVQSFRDVREEEMSKMINIISSSSSFPINLGKLVMSLSNNIICRIALGRKCEGEFGKNRFYEALEEGEALISGFYVGDFFPMMGWIDRVTGAMRRLEKNIEQFDAFYEEVLEEHLDPKRMKPQQEDLVNVLLQQQKDRNYLSRAHIKAILMDMFTAGTQTTTATIVWAMSELTRNPTAMKKAQEEVRGSVGTKGKVVEEDLHQLKYIKLVVKETLRLHPPVPLLLPRETIRHCRINGYDVLPKTHVFVNVWGIGRDPKSWDNPEEFYPDRFMDSSIDFKGHDLELLPFGSGRRICPALHFGSLSVELALANLLYSFDWKLPDGMTKEDLDMTEAPGITLQRRSPLFLVSIKQEMK